VSESLSSVSGIVGIASGIFTVIGFGVILFQIQMAKNSATDSTRARLQINLELLGENKKKYVILVIRNTGVLPARDVQISFDEGIKFHAVRGSDKFLFLAPNRIRELQHGETIAFRLGATSGPSNMEHVFSSNLTGIVTYKYTTKDRQTKEGFSVTLDQSGFIVYRKSI
jgi:hypothetical protein